MRENTEAEEWRSIEGYEGYYQVSSLGRVKSLSRLANFNGGIGLRKGKILKPGVVTDGYLQVVLCKDGKHTKFLVHRLVGMAFQDICGQYVNGLEIDHKNCCRTDNRAINLRWVTRKENNNNPITRQRRSVPIIQMDRQGIFINEFDGLSDAARILGISTGCICMVLKGQRNHTHGYIFRYKEEYQNKAI